MIFLSHGLILNIKIKKIVQVKARKFGVFLNKKKTGKTGLFW